MPFSELAALDHPDRHSAVLQHLTVFCESSEVLIEEDVFDPKGHLLLQRGRRLTSQLAASFKGRELYHPLERCLRVRNGLYSSLRERARSHIDQDELMQRLLPTQEMRHDVITLIGELRLNPTLEWLLTCLDVTHKGALNHHIGVAAMSCMTAMQAKLPETELRKVVAAAMFHDIGDLYIAPDPAGGKGELTLERWGQMVLHPLISRNILTDFALLPADVTQAVAEHHERSNGGGYPHKTSSLSQLGSILAISEALIGVLGSGGNSGRRAYMALHFERDEFANGVASLLTPFLTHIDVQNTAPDNVDPMKLMPKLKALTTLMANAERLVEDIRENPVNADLLAHIRARLQRLNSTLNATGMSDPVMLFEQILEGHDTRMLLEMDMTTREIIWRLRYLARSVSLDLAPMPPMHQKLFEPFLELLSKTPDARG
ncbi:HD-GYP domain-containing protein [Amphibiibacter pelophylacis]|uniref:HD domain-containing protein n=1 Tax=Amphibiibacter pelophylacis TaxID=1799477 RepID=A0ACC6P549_9BURK